MPHGPRQFLPLGGFNGQLLPPLRSEPVILGPAIVFRRSFLERDPASFDEPVERRIKRTLLYLQYIFGGALDRFCNSVAVQRPEQKNLQNEQIERSLQKLDAVPVFLGRHSR